MHWVIGAMPHPHQPDPTVRKSAITRTCPACGRDQMRLTREAIDPLRQLERMRLPMWLRRGSRVRHDAAGAGI